MNSDQPERPTIAAWARFRFALVGALLSAPPARGELRASLRVLAAKTWSHPIDGRDMRISFATLERWYYQARRAKEDPVGELRRAPRRDRGRVSLTAELIEQLSRQHREHPHWSYQLHYDNLVAWAQGKGLAESLRSYVTVRRYMQAHGLLRTRRATPKGRPGEERPCPFRKRAKSLQLFAFSSHFRFAESDVLNRGKTPDRSMSGSNSEWEQCGRRLSGAAGSRAVVRVATVEVPRRNPDLW